MQKKIYSSNTVKNCTYLLMMCCIMIIMSLQKMQAAYKTKAHINAQIEAWHKKRGGIKRREDHQQKFSFSNAVMKIITVFKTKKSKVVYTE